MLDSHTLVLNKSWIPINIISVKKAISMVFRNTAKIIDVGTYETHSFDSWKNLSVSEDEPHIRTVSLRIKIPEIIVLMSYDKIPKREVVFSRYNIYRRDNYTCQYCGRKPGIKNLTIDHVIPRCQGGKSTWTNCVLACTECNTKKAGKTPAQAGMKLIREPKEPKWTPTLFLKIGEKKESWKEFVNHEYWHSRLEA